MNARESTKTVFPTTQPSADPLIVTLCPARTVAGETESDGRVTPAAAATLIIAAVTAAIPKTTRITGKKVPTYGKSVAGALVPDGEAS
jgi:hypothetical protein